MSRFSELTHRKLHVAAGVLADGCGRILITDRAHAATLQQFWEFPGGKLATGESAEDALRRELAEELGITITSFEHLRSLEHHYPGLSVAIDFYRVTAWQGTPSGLEGQKLKWLKPSALSSGILLPADAPLVELLQNL